MSPALTHILMSFLKRERNCQEYSWCNRVTTWAPFYWSELHLWLFFFMSGPRGKEHFSLDVYWLRVPVTHQASLRKIKGELKAWGGGRRVVLSGQGQEPSWTSESIGSRARVTSRTISLQTCFLWFMIIKWTYVCQPLPSTWQFQRETKNP